SRFQTTPLDPNRGRVLAPYSSTASDLGAVVVLVRLVQDPANGDQYAWPHRTSMAAPHLAEVVGLIRAQHPNMSVGAVISVIRGTATAQGCPAALDLGVVF